MPLRCHFKTSYCLIFAVVLLHLAAILIVAFTELRFPFKLGLMGVIFFALIVSLLSNAKLSRNLSNSSLLIDADSVTFFAGSTPLWEGVVQSSSLVTSHFAILCIKARTSGKMHFQLVCQDALSKDEFRQLRTLLMLI